MVAHTWGATGLEISRGGVHDCGAVPEARGSLGTPTDPTPEAMGMEEAVVTAVAPVGVAVVAGEMVLPILTPEAAAT